MSSNTVPKPAKLTAIAAVLAAIVLGVWWGNSHDRQASVPDSVIPRDKNNGLPLTTIAHTVQPAESAPPHESELVAPRKELHPPESRSPLRNQVLLESSWILSHVHFDPAKLERLKTLLVERDQAQLDAADAAQRNGLDSKERAAAMREAARAVDAEIRSSLGDRDYSEYHDRALESGAIAHVRRTFAGATLDAGAPLSEAQIEQLGVLFTDAAYRDPGAQNHATRLVDPTTGLRQIDVAFIAKASAVVTPEQLSVIRDVTLKNNHHSGPATRGP